MEIRNKNARRDHQILETFEAGIVLLGSEVKSIRDGKASLNAAHARVINGEVWLINANITGYEKSSPAGYDPLRTRKLLLSRHEIASLSAKLGQNKQGFHGNGKLTLVPISLYTKGRLVKAKLALARGTRIFEKRAIKKQKDIERDVQRELKDL